MNIILAQFDDMVRNVANSSRLQDMHDFVEAGGNTFSKFDRGVFGLDARLRDDLVVHSKYVSLASSR